MLEAALAYARRGWRVFPLFGPKDTVPKDGQPGKTPRTVHGVKDATTDEAQIRKWWGMWPSSNIGLATGAEFVVLDIDGPDAELQLESQGYEAPESLEVRTGRGRHVYLRGDVSIRNRTRLIGGQKGVDIRGDGGYVVAPPSIHENGRVYEFSDPDAPLAEIPQWLRELHGARKQVAVDLADETPIPDGGRNDELARIAGSYRAKGLAFPEIFTLLQSVNARRCNPPLDESEVRKIAESIARYPVDEIEIPDVWGWTPEQLKQRGADESAVAQLVKAQEAVKKSLPEPGSATIKMELKRRWSRDSAREVELVATLTVGDARAVVGRLRGRDVLTQSVMAALCFEQGLSLPKIKAADWRKLAAAALAERHDEEITEEETITGACVVAALEFISDLADTARWADFPVCNDTHRFRHEDGLYSVSAKRLREAIQRQVRDARRTEINEALRRLSAYKHTPKRGAPVMYRVRVDRAGEAGYSSGSGAPSAEQHRDAEQQSVAEQSKHTTMYPKS